MLIFLPATFLQAGIRHGAWSPSDHFNYEVEASSRGRIRKHLSS